MGENDLVWLEWYECEVAAHVGLRRQCEAWKEKLDRNSPFFARDKRSPLENHVEGAGAELAVSKRLCLPWRATINTFIQGPPDVGECTEVRWREREDYDLLVRPEDHNDRFYVLVKGAMPRYSMRGWIKGFEAKQDRYLKDPGGHNRPCYLVPESDLRPLPPRPERIVKLRIIKKLG